MTAPARHPAFTIDTLDWTPWLPPVDPAAATPEQRRALSGLPTKLRTNAYSLVLAHDAEALAERVPLFGCVYCASVHGRRFADLTGEPEVIHGIYRDGVADAPLDSRRRAIVNAAVKLSATPSRLDHSDIAALRAEGLDDLAILDLIHAVAMFAWANRLMLTLGEPTRP